MKGKRSFWMLALAVLVLSMASVPMRAFAEEQEGGDTGVTITAVTVGSITRQEDQRDTASGYADPETGTWVEEEWQQLNCGPSNVHVELSNGESFDGQEWEIRDALRSYFNAPDVHWETDETPQSLWSAGQTYTARLYVEGVVAEYSVTVEAAPELETVIYDANGGTLTNTADQSVIGETYTARCESGAEPLLRLGYETLHASEGREKVYLSRMTVSDETAGVSFTAVREGYILAGWQVEGADVTYPENAGNPKVFRRCPCSERCKL